MLATRGGVPRGLRSFLHAARRERAGKTGLRLTISPGPGLDRLRQPGTVPRLREALASHLGYTPDIDIVEGRETGPSAPRHVSPKQARRERLQELVEREPLLARAVEELDLELVD